MNIRSPAFDNPFLITLVMKNSYRTRKKLISVSTFLMLQKKNMYIHHLICDLCKSEQNVFSNYKNRINRKDAQFRQKKNYKKFSKRHGKRSNTKKRTHRKLFKSTTQDRRFLKTVTQCRKVCRFILTIAVVCGITESILKDRGVIDFQGK